VRKNDGQACCCCARTPEKVDELGELKRSGDAREKANLRENSEMS
jgi:hypothetical protein